jgi:cobalt-zinc-cadmium efflux system membrane fusion protein
MLAIEPLNQVHALPTAAMPAHVAFAEDLVTSVPAPVAARVLSVHAHAGDAVARGDLLAVLLSGDALQTRSDVAAARIARDAAMVEASRQQLMHERGVGTEVELHASQARLRETQQALSRAQGSAQLLGAGQGDRLEVRSPRAGIVAQRSAGPGAAVEAGAALFMVGDPRSLGVAAQAFEADLTQLRVNAPVTVSLPQLSYHGPGRVRHIGAELDRDTRRATVFVALGEAVPGLRPGMLAKVEAQADAAHETVVPVSAVLIKDGSRSIVFVQRGDNLFEARDVQLGQPVRGVVPVLGGLAPGDRIVVRGGLLLDGAASQML